MDADYNGHHIEAYAWLVPDGRWVCRLIISWSEVGRVLFKCPYIARTFETMDEGFYLQKNGSMTGSRIFKHDPRMGRPGPRL